MIVKKNLLKCKKMKINSTALYFSAYIKFIDKLSQKKQEILTHFFSQKPDL